MVVVFAALLGIHGLIHLIGLTRPHSGLWATAAVLFAAATAALFVWPRWWWALAAVAVVISMTAIGQAWAEARTGTVVNAVILVGVVVGFMAQGPVSLRAQYEHDVRAGIGALALSPVIHDEDLDRLPAPVQRYLRKAGVTGQPRVHSFLVRMHGRIRSGPDAPWMPITSEQYNVVETPARLFYLTGTMRGMPVQGFHRYVGSTASMVVKVAGIVPVVQASGPVMDLSETVTLFNDMCVMAPATLIDARIQWIPVDEQHARARFTNGEHTITAELLFNELGELVDFRSEDRYAVAPDGAPPRRMTWSTPVGSYRDFGGVRIASSGRGLWHEPSGEYAYIELSIDDVRYNVPRP